MNKCKRCAPTGVVQRLGVKKMTLWKVRVLDRGERVFRRVEERKWLWKSHTDQEYKQKVCESMDT
jgi:hypothetical protein